MNENACPSSANPDPIDIAIGARLRLRRLALGLSQGALARSLGVTFQQIQKYERGTNRIFASRLFHLARILRVPVSFFFQDITAEGEIRPANMTAESSPATDYEAVGDLLDRNDSLKLIRAFNRIDDPGIRRQIYALVRSVSEQDGLEARFR